jgi:ribonuclease P protein subunit RPR2
MAKKGKDDAPNPNSVANRDIIQRLNFLYQASVYLNTIPTPAQPVASTSSSGQYAAKSVNARKELKKKSTRIFTTSDLARTYIANMKIVGQKTTVKMFVLIQHLYRFMLRSCHNDNA